MSRSWTSTTAEAAASGSLLEQVDDALETDGEADGRHVRAEEPADHAVVAAAAAERVVDDGWASSKIVPV